MVFTRVGTDAFHCERRELVFERDIFRLGTAMVDLLSVRPARTRVGEVVGCECCVRLVLVGFEHETVEGCPARINDLTGLPHTGFCETFTGLGVETRAIFAAHRLERKRQHHSVSDCRFTLHVIIVNLVVKSVVTRIREKLLKLDFDGDGHRVETPNALPRRRGVDTASDQNAIVEAFES